MGPQIHILMKNKTFHEELPVWTSLKAVIKKERMKIFAEGFVDSIQKSGMPNYVKNSLPPVPCLFSSFTFWSSE